jgi:BMFP domain-containing protein YqiC
MLKGLTPPEKETICTLMRNAVDQLDREDFKILQDNLVDTRWNHSKLTDALNELGFKCHNDQVRLHRTRKCICA